MEQSTVAEQRATAVAKLKRAASLPRMKDGRRPPMHVEAVSEGERGQSGERDEEDGAQDSDEKQDQDPTEEAPVVEVKTEEVEPELPPPEAPVLAENTNTRTKRRSRSRTRSRGSRDLKGKIPQKQSPHVSSASHTNESSADEYTNASATGEDAPPPSPPLVSPIPSHFTGLPASHLLRSMSPPVPPLFYPGTTPSTPLPTLDDLSKGMMGFGLFRSNSAGAARALTLQKLVGNSEPVDMTYISPSSTPPLSGRGLMRNNTVAGGERLAARKLMLHALGNRLKDADSEQTSGGEEAPPPTSKRRRRRSKRSSSRASTVVDDRDEREAPSAIPDTPAPVILPLSSNPLLSSLPSSSTSRTLVGDGEQMSPSRGNGDIYEMPMGRRGPVVEDEDDVPLSPPRLPYPGLPTTPSRGYAQGSRLPHASDAPSSTSTDSAPPSAVPVPVFFSRNPGFKDVFPESPFATPLKEKAYPDEDEEQVLYQEVNSRSRFAAANSFNRQSEISWVADPVPERMPVNDDDDEEDEEEDRDLTHEPDADAELEEDIPSEQPSSPSVAAISPRLSSYKDLVVDVETSPETSPNIPPSPSSIIVLSTPALNDQPVSAPSPSKYPMRLTRSPSAAETLDWDDPRPIADSTPKRGGEGVAARTWETIKSITRAGSTSGRRSRTNSINARDRRYNTDSSVSRESGVSQTSAKPEKGDMSPGVFAHQQAQPPLMQTPSASASILSLSPQSAPPGGVSPIPPASSADLLKYADSKLFPFPGMKQLEEQRNEQRNRANGNNPSASVPDMIFANGIEAVPSSGSSSTATRQMESGRERKLSHQASDSRLIMKYSDVQPSPMAPGPSSATQTDYFNVQPVASGSSNGGSLRLPMNMEGVKKWLSAKKVFSPQSSTPSTPNFSSHSAPLPDRRPGATKKPSLSDLLMSRKTTDLVTDWEDIGNDKSRTPTSVASGRSNKLPQEDRGALNEAHTPSNGHIGNGTFSESSQPPDTDLTMRANGSASGPFIVPDFSPSFSAPEPPSSTTPDPQSSLDEFPTRSTSESFSSTVSSSQHSPDRPAAEPSQSVIIMERLEEILGRGSKSSLWPSAIDDPPRKLVLSSPVLQVTNANTVKDRFLFLFNDILIIAKPIIQDQDTLLDATKPSPSDRKFIVKSVVRLRDLRFSADRDESRSKASGNLNPMRHPVIRNFVNQFNKDPDDAIVNLWSRTSTRDDPVALGQLMFKTLDLDRVRLGEFLSRRSSKLALKAYVDSFGLAGMRIDKALRVFLLAIAIPSKASGQANALEYLLDAFASRWYEANAGIVAYDKDLAVRLVRATAQLNEVMHGGIAHEPGITGYPRRNVTSRDFIEAFRRFDPRCLVSDDLLDKIYTSIRRERLSQARIATSQSPEIPIVIKKALPLRLTYRIQSDPIILRIPQPDPQFTIQLFGQDLIFDPPALNFAKSSEASFRVTGTSLGPKTIIMWRSGPNALVYSGLPLSSPLVVERAFMRNTFQMAFMNHTGAKRKYMFSVDDPLIRHQWTVSLKRQIDIASSSTTAEGPGAQSDKYKANERLAFRVLQETLIGSDGDHHSSREAAAVSQALARLNGSASMHHHMNGASANGSGPSRLDGASLHVRSKSRSKVYHQHGPGKMELELSDNPDLSNDEETHVHEFRSEPLRPECRLWNGHDLEMICRQNSSIPATLAYLQVGPFDKLNGSGS